MSEELKIGDVVRLKSEPEHVAYNEKYWINPWMTVIYTRTNGVVDCGWFSRNRKYHTNGFLIDSLVKREITD